MKKIVIFLFLVSLLLNSCSKKENPVTVKYDDYSSVTVKVNKTYYFPVYLVLNSKDTNFIVKEKPVDSKEILIYNGRYVEWTPKVVGIYNIKAVAPNGYFEQNFEIKVVK